MPPRNIIHVEVTLKSNSECSEERLKGAIDNWIERQSSYSIENKIIAFDDNLLTQDVEAIQLEKENLDPYETQFTFKCHLYKLDCSAPNLEDHISSWSLPTKAFDGEWESLVYKGGLKQRLLRFLINSLNLSSKFDANLISSSRILLLHGPAGTGKTTLARALAQKLSIRLKYKFDSGKLVESGKHVTELFHQIEKLVKNPKTLVIVLLDQVENLARSRASCIEGTDPGNPLLDVNVLLRHLDMIKRYPNIIIIATTNLPEVIDVSFIDRVDLKQFVGLPDKDELYDIFCICIEELQKKEIIQTGHIKVNNWLRSASPLSEEDVITLEKKVKAVAEKSCGISSHMARNLPLFAYAKYAETSDEGMAIQEYLENLSKEVDKFKENRS